MTPRLNADDIAAMGIGHLVQAIRSQTDALTNELAVAHGDTNATANKAAARRARKISNQLTKLLAAYRKASV